MSFKSELQAIIEDRGMSTAEQYMRAKNLIQDELAGCKEENFMHDRFDYNQGYNEALRRINLRLNRAIEDLE